ncbi:MAG: RidA family protein, partial [Candidatus Binatia bacterium]
LQDVVLLNAFMKDISRIDVFRALRRQYIDQENPPAITTVGVTGLAHPDLLIEIAAFAEISPRKRAKRASRRRRRTG